MSKTLIIQLIADYGVGDPAFGEVVQKFTYLDRNIRVKTTSVPAFSTVATGLWIYQFACVNAFPGLIIFSNTAPRKTIEGFHEPVDGGRLVYTHLANGAIVLAVNTGYCLSFLKDKIKKLFLVNVPNVGSQFRSRDYYPDAVVGIVHGERKYLGKELSPAAIPEVPTNLIAFIDGYGNMKTSMRESQSRYPQGSRIYLTCNNITLAGIVAGETYKVNDTELSFAPGSTGGKDRFMEIWVRGGSAWEAFRHPRVEQIFTIKLLPNSSV